MIRRRSKPRRGRVYDHDFVEGVYNQGCVIREHGTTDAAKEHVCDTRPTIHHVRRFGSPKDDHRILPICESGHLHDAGPHSIERGKAQWQRWWGIDIEGMVEWYRETLQVVETDVRWGLGAK
jgi:hypothetical protein